MRGQQHPRSNSKETRSNFSRSKSVDKLHKVKDSRPFEELKRFSNENGGGNSKHSHTKTYERDDNAREQRPERPKSSLERRSSMRREARKHQMNQSGRFFWM